MTSDGLCSGPGSTIVIETMFEKFSTAIMVSGTGVARGHIVRLNAQ